VRDDAALHSGSRHRRAGMSPGNGAFDRDVKPRFPRGVRLRLDETRGQWTLLAPERVFKADAVAAEVLKRCDGERTLGAIVDELAAAFSADRARVEADVRDLLGQLAQKRLIDL
jgi:coenzyme PQQ biosynthesis protein PqqD